MRLFKNIFPWAMAFVGIIFASILSYFTVVKPGMGGLLFFYGFTEAVECYVNIKYSNVEKIDDLFDNYDGKVKTIQKDCIDRIKRYTNTRQKRHHRFFWFN